MVAGLMSYLDTALLDLVERFARRFQVLTGRTNVWLAVQLTNASIVVYFVWSAVVYAFATLAVRTFVGLFCAGVFWALTQTVFRVPIEVYENSAYRRVAKGLRNPRRVRDASLRISFVTLSILLSGPVVFVYVTLHLRIFVGGYLLVLLTTAVLYLLACDPLARRPAAVREWATRLLAIRQPSSKPVGAEGRVETNGASPAVSSNQSNETNSAASSMRVAA